MSNNTVIIKHTIYELCSEYSRFEIYPFVEDSKGKLYETHYGKNEGDSWYITCYENLETRELIEEVFPQFYYRRVGRVPYVVKKIKDFKEMVGRTLHEESVNGRNLLGFHDYDANVFYYAENNTVTKALETNFTLNQSETKEILSAPRRAIKEFDIFNDIKLSQANKVKHATNILKSRK